GRERRRAPPVSRTPGGAEGLPSPRTVLTPPRFLERAAEAEFVAELPQPLHRAAAALLRTAAALHRAATALHRHSEAVRKLRRTEDDQRAYLARCRFDHDVRHGFRRLQCGSTRCANGSGPAAASASRADLAAADPAAAPNPTVPPDEIPHPGNEYRHACVGFGWLKVVWQGRRYGSGRGQRTGRAPRTGRRGIAG